MKQPRGKSADVSEVFELRLSKKEARLALEIVGIVSKAVVSAPDDAAWVSARLVMKLGALHQSGGTARLDRHEAQLLFMSTNAMALASTGGSSKEKQCKQLASRVAELELGPVHVGRVSGPPD